MDSDRFDWLSRFVAQGAPRRAVLGMATALGLSIFLEAASKTRKKRRRKRKERCRKLGQTCSSGGKRRCCNGRTCDVAGPDGVGPPRCCQPNLGRCEQDHDCCGLSVCGGDGPEPRCLFIPQP